MIRLCNIKVDIKEERTLLDEIIRNLGVRKKDIKSLQIVKKSIDARDKKRILFVYSVDVEVENEKQVLKKAKGKAFPAPCEEYLPPKKGKIPLSHPPVIIGSGPAGLFAAYLLAEQGYHPIVLERGEKMEKRIETVEKFFTTGRLDPNSNVQFGEGGAGTFSDGKLKTMAKDPIFREKKIFEIFVKHGAPKEILYLQHPHIGTDLLRSVIINMREEIIKMGGTFHYRSMVTDFIMEDGKIREVVVNNTKHIPCEVALLAIGHSARDTFQLLYEKQMHIESKPFAIGVRVMHPQEMINTMQYGDYKKDLPPASYKLTYQSTNHRGVYSFCMCPGGYVVNASSEKERVVVNGMSNYKRESQTANSAIVVTVGPKDFGMHPFGGVMYQQKLEEACYKIGMGKIPIQLWRDFLNCKRTVSLGKVKPEIKGEYVLSDLNNILPKEITVALKEAIVSFDKKIKGFSRDDMILAGVETRTSSPIRMVRDASLQSNLLGIYPCGEGSGYAGGITTSAMDGMKAAEEIIKKYCRK